MRQNFVHWHPWAAANEQIRQDRPAAPRLGEHRLKAETFQDGTICLYYFGDNTSALPTKFSLITHPESTHVCPPSEDTYQGA